MKKLSIILTLLLICNLSSLKLYAQYIDDRIDFNLSYGIGFAVGSELINENGFITPSLFNGYSNIMFLSGNTVYKIHPNYSAGMQINLIKFSSWKNHDSDLFENSYSKIATIGPVIRFHPKFNKEGTQKKAKAYLGVNPFIAFSKSSLIRENLFEIDPLSDPNAVINSKYTSIGIRIRTGITYYATQNTYLNLNIGINYLRLNSQFYNDRSLVLPDIGAGFTFIILKDKRFYL